MEDPQEPWSNYCQKQGGFSIETQGVRAMNELLNVVSRERRKAEAT